MSTVLAYCEKGKTPFFAENRAEVFETENKRIMIDALIFNRDELISESGDELLDDANLLFSLIEREGWDVLKRVNGDFAGAVYEKQTGIWVLFRDHLGVRPLFYYSDLNHLVVATDMCDIAGIQGVCLRIDEKQVWLRLAGYMSNSLRKTDFDNIHCVCPGSATVFTPSDNGYKMIENRYFKPGMSKIKMNSDEEYIAEMRRLVEDSVRRRTEVIKGTAGAELSGGLDSSVIDILVNRTGKPLKCVSWKIVPDDWPIQPVDERIVIRDICKQENLECEFISNDDPPIESDKYSLEPPFANTQILGQIARVMKEKGISYIFSGQGGDEGVSHRGNILELWHAGEFRYYFRELWKKTNNRRFRIVRFLYYLIRGLIIDYPRKMKTWQTALNSLDLITDDFKKKMNDVTGGPLLFGIDQREEFEHGGIRLRPETAAYQTEKFGVQYLYPFEDYRVFDFALSIPRHLFLKDGIDRWIYRRAFDDIMPQSLRDVNYKDFPSVRNGGPKNDDRQDSIETLKKKYLDELDRTIWNGIIDFSALEKIAVYDDNTDEKKQLIVLSSLSNLHNLLLIQRMLKVNEK